MTSRSRNRTTTSTGGSARDAHRPRGGRGGMGVGRSPPRHRGDGRQLRRGAPEPPRGAGEGPFSCLPPLRAPDGAGGARASCAQQLGMLRGRGAGRGEKRPGGAPRPPVGTPGGSGWARLAPGHCWPTLSTGPDTDWPPQLDRKGHRPERAPAALAPGTENPVPGKFHGGKSRHGNSRARRPSAGCFRGLFLVKRGGVPTTAPGQNRHKGLRGASCRPPPRSAVCRLSR